MTDWQEVGAKSKLIKLDTKGNIIVPTFGECIANNKLFYVQEGLKRFEYNGSENFNEIYKNIRVLPIVSDPTSPDGDGLNDIEDPNPLKYQTTIIYNRDHAVLYAFEWYNGFNSQYYHYDSDCANFVSQCLNAGNISMNKSWHSYATPIFPFYANPFMLTLLLILNIHINGM